jgi:hypothetical protein
MLVRLELSNESNCHVADTGQSFIAHYVVWVCLWDDCMLQSVENIAETPTRIREIRQNFVLVCAQLLVRCARLKTCLTQIDSFFNRIHVVFFRDVKYSDSKIMWFVLYPYLSQRLVRRSVLSGSQNWQILKQKFKSRSISSLNLFKSAQQRVADALGYSKTLGAMQESARNDHFDVSFASIVRSGRRFASGVFSILVFTFVGTLTSALSIWVCKERDGVMYLNQDANVECSMHSPEYQQLFNIAMFGLILYGFILPVSIFLLLRSKWCKQMMMYDLSGFDALFGFLTSRYSTKCYMWEVVIFFQKTASVLIPTYNSDSAVQQSVLMLFVSIIYLFLILKFSPFANDMMNFIEKLCNINLFLMYFCALLFVAEVDGTDVIQGQLKDTVGICLCVLSLLSLVSTVFCAWCVNATSLFTCKILFNNIDSYLSRYECTQMVLLHKNVFASKWMQAMRTTLGGTFTGDNAFALLYVMYNPVCRRNIYQKQRASNHMLAEALLPLELEYSGPGRHKTLWFHIKSSWAVLKFTLKNRAMAECNPSLVLSASKYAHAAIFKDLNRILLLVQNCERDAVTNWNIARKSVLTKFRGVKALRNFPVHGLQAADDYVKNHDAKLSSQNMQSSVTWLQKIQNCWTRSNRVLPSQVDNQQRHDDAPKLFVDHFNLKRTFVEENIDEEARLSLLTLMIFHDAEDFGLSLDCKVYKKQFDDNLESFQNVFRALFRLSKALKSADSSEKLTHKERIFQRISDMMFGEEQKLLRNFHWLADEDAVDLFKLHQFPELEAKHLRIPSVDEVLKQLVAKDKEKSVEESTIGSQPQSLQSTHDNFFPSTLMTCAPVAQQPSDQVIDLALFIKTKGTGPNIARARPTMYSSKSILSAAKESSEISLFKAAGSLQQDTSSDEALMRTELFSARAEIANLKATLQIETANALAKEAELKKHAATAEAKALALASEMTDLRALLAAKDTSSDEAVMRTELFSAHAEIANLKATLQIETANALAKEAEALHAQENSISLSGRVKSLEAELQQKTAAAEAKVLAAEQELLLLRAEIKMKGPAAVVAASTAQVTDLQRSPQASKAGTISAADQQALAVHAESEQVTQVALSQRNQISIDAKAEVDVAKDASAPNDVDDECVGRQASGGGAAATNTSTSQTAQPTLRISQISQTASYLKQKFSRAKKAPSFKEVSHFSLIPCSIFSLTDALFPGTALVKHHV